MNTRVNCPFTCLNEIATIRDCDWAELSRHFVIPEPIEAIETTPIFCRNGKVKSLPSPPSSARRSVAPLFDD
ncbi:MAG: hypothetical protein NZM06_01890 [Chloroherpetonaceae bacterium]|nr:hypothetical protein [Chloroherpetonaceae bacterium]MDW8437184.1 hypothetical protein [Chloroherpetonaceae bacterium]